MYQQPDGFTPFPNQKRMQHDGPNHPKFLRTMPVPMKPPAPSATRHHYQHGQNYDHHGCDDTNMDSDASSDAESGNEGVHWTRQEDNLLREAVIKFNGKAWKRIAEYCFPDGSRDKDQCLQRWRMISKPRSIKGPWTPEEDRQLRTLVNELGAEKWVLIASRLGSRTGKQCRERWHNHLDPRIDKSPFTAQEDELIFKLFAQFGSKWAEMSKLMPGRPDNAIKNHFNTSMQRKRRRLSLQDPSERRHSMPSLALTPKSQQGPNVHINHKRSGSRDYLTKNSQHYQHHTSSAGSGGYPCSNPTLIKTPDSRMSQPLSLGMSRSVSLGSSERQSAVPRSTLGPQLHQPPLQNGQMRPNLPGIGSLHSGQYPHVASTMAAMASSSSTAVTSLALSTSPTSKLSRSISASMVTTSMNGRSCPDHPGDSYHTVQRHNMTRHETMGARPSWLARGHGHEHHRSLDADPFSALSELANVAEQYRELPCGNRATNTTTTVVVQSKDETDEGHFQRRGSNGSEPMTRSRSGSSGSITMEEAVIMTKIERPLPPPSTGPIGRRFSTLGHVKEEEHGEDGENNQHQYHSNLIDPRNNAASPLGHNRSYSDWSHGGSRDLGSASYRSKRLSVDFSPSSEMTMEDDDDCVDEDRLVTRHDRNLDDRHNRKGPHFASPPCSSSGHNSPYLAKRRPSVRDLMAINHLCLNSEEVERS
ncbi:Transcription factor myb3r-5 [Mortierella polycephala]|uniref:Transcription factor myb3r-5 n=1 Tax=Mortierella polycephala TaxID=41804 RepID=A0A9P6UA11_9FUNG|nr:Transcription factor myb3r-5 [Mortierella polycephala]